MNADGVTREIVVEGVTIQYVTPEQMQKLRERRYPILADDLDGVGGESADT